MTNRFWIASSDDRADDYSFVEFGLNWLVEGKDKLILYVPGRQQLESSYLSRLININYSAEKATETTMFPWLGKWVSVTTDDDMKEINEPVRMFAAWCDDKSLVKLEVIYNINDILALPWVPDCDINRWKQETNPTQLTLEENAGKVLNKIKATKEVSKTEEYFQQHPEEKSVVIQKANTLLEELEKAIQEYNKINQLSNSLPLTKENKTLHYNVGGYLENQRQKVDDLFHFCWFNKIKETKDIARKALKMLPKRNW